MFYDQRSDSEYYQVVRGLLSSLGHMDSILDVGAWDSPVATWGDFSHRYTLDRRPSPLLPGVQSLIGTWPAAADICPRASVVCCLQVIEHVVDVVPFVTALFAQAHDHVIISVPYLWPSTACKWHVHDPVGFQKLHDWTGRESTWCRITDDTPGDPPRLIAEYTVGT